MNFDMKKLFRGASLLVVGGIFGMAYIFKWMPFPLFPLNRFQLIVDDLWVCMGWMMWLIFTLPGVADIVEVLY